MLRSVCSGELVDKLEAVKGQVTKIDSAGWASAAGPHSDMQCQLQHLGPPVRRRCAAR